MDLILKINKKTLNIKKISLFLALTFGFSWLTALIIYMTGIEYGSVLSMVLVAVFYMPAPALSTIIVQKWIYKEKTKSYGWILKGLSIKWLFATIVLSICFVLGTIGIVYLFGNELGIESFGKMDFSEEGFNSKIINIIYESIEESNLNIDLESQLSESPITINPIWIFLIILVVGIVAAFTINIPFMFGEEFGWRGLLLKETQNLGFLKSNLFIGLIWGFWHAPIILMGHNYPENPIIGVGMMILLTIVISFPFAYSRLKTKSILGPCIMHGMLNGTAGSVVLFTNGGNNLICSIAGVAGIIGITFVTLGIFLFDKKFIREYKIL